MSTKKSPPHNHKNNQSQQVIKPIKIQISYFFNFRDLTGKKEETVSLKEEATVRDTLLLLARRHGSAFHKAIFEGSEIRRYIHILINGRDIQGLNGLDTELRSGDEVSIFPPVGGG